MKEHYMAVLVDLRNQKAKLEAEVQKMDVAIAAIQALMGVSVSPAHPFIPPMPVPYYHAAQPDSGDAAHRFAKISVRWAALWHLYDFGDQFQKTGEIAAAILAGGYKSEAGRFGNLVSAVISGMKTKGEVETNDDGGYRLTAKGRATWELIRQGGKFRASTMAEPSLPIQ